MRVRSQVVAIAIILLGGGKAFAQGTYVSASVMADIVRATHAQYPGAPDGANGGEAIGFALRAGTPLGSVWGVELEFARPAEIENEFQPGVFPLAGVADGIFNVTPEVAGSINLGILQPISLAPSLRYSVRSRQRDTTLGVSLWAHQQLSGRVAIVYLGGAAFSRSEYQSEISFSPFVAVAPIRILPPPSRTETVVYGVRPMVGLESRIEMNEHAHLVPGIRLQAGDGRWLIRPAVGIAWSF